MATQANSHFIMFGIISKEEHCEESAGEGECDIDVHERHTDSPAYLIHNFTTHHFLFSSWLAPSALVGLPV